MQGETGWDSFVLNYQTDLPINTIITKGSIHLYKKLFVFLWKLKRVEYGLSAGWKDHMRLATSLKKIKGNKSTMVNCCIFGLLDVSWDLHKCRLVSNEMTQFIYQLQYYYQFEVRLGLDGTFWHILS